MTRIHNPRSEPPPRTSRKPVVSRQKRARLDANARYLADHDEFLEHNPVCAAHLAGWAGCPSRPANQVHHICRGIHRAKTLLNQNTWLQACSTECHDWLEKLPVAVQQQIKHLTTDAAIERA